MESVCFKDGTILHIEDIALAKLLKYVCRENAHIGAFSRYDLFIF